MRKETIDSLVCYRADLLKDQSGIIHASLTRKNGASPAPYDSLNLSYDVGDNPENVTQNIESVRLALGADRIVWARQVHGTRIVDVDNGSPQEIIDCDGLATQTPGVALMIKQADCQACVFYDPIQRVIAAVHAGWRGNVADSYGVALAHLKARYGCHPKNLLVCISPSLGPDAAEFVNYRDEIPQEFWKYKRGDCHFDLWALAEDQLIGHGVAPENIEIARICTWSEPKDFFSYRQSHITGRHATCVMLR